MDEFKEMPRGQWTEEAEHEYRQASGTEALVCDDIALRQILGKHKYGTTVCANPLELREWLQHAYEECLDQAIYLKRALQEIERKQS